MPGVQEGHRQPADPRLRAEVGLQGAQVQAEKRAKTAERERARKKRQSEQHPFESCRDDSCKRPMCVAYRTGWHEGHFAGFDEGFAAGFGAGFAAGHEEGFKEGLASCPGPHGSGN
jgi:hypothetical protein